MSIYYFNNSELQAYNNMRAAIQNNDTYADVPRIDLEQALDLYKKALSESNLGYMYNQNQICMRDGFLGCRIDFEMCDEFKSGRIKTDIRIIPEITGMMSMAQKEKSVYEAIKSVYAYFVKNFEYAYNHGADLRYHSAISVFLYRKSVCEGFALAFSNVLNRLGIPCGIVTGYSSLDGANSAHTWNIVELNKKYYHLDVTWDICTKEKGNDIFDYFFLDDGLARKDHQWDDASIPVALDGTKEFYMQNKRCCMNEQECVSVIASGLRQKKKDISFRFIGSGVQNVINVQNVKKLFEFTVTKGHFAYRSVLFSVNSACGTVYFSLSY